MKILIAAVIILVLLNVLIYGIIIGGTGTVSQHPTVTPPSNISASNFTPSPTRTAPPNTPAPSPYLSPSPSSTIATPVRRLPTPTPKPTPPLAPTPTPTPTSTPSALVTEQTALVVEPGRVNQLNLRFANGDRAQFKVSVPVEDVRFIVKDPNGTVVVNAEKVNNKVFEIVAEYSGNYQAIFVHPSESSAVNRVVTLQIQHSGDFLFPNYPGTYVPLTPKETRTVGVMLVANQGLKGTIKIEGGQQDIVFSVRDQLGTLIAAPREIHYSSDFVFAAAADGTYTLVFDNGRSGSMSKLVSLEMFTNPGGQWQPWSGTPAKLVFTRQPAGVAGAKLDPQPVVSIQDGAGNTQTDSSVSVNLVLVSDNGSSGAILSGNTMVTTVNGVATFKDLSVDLPGTGYILSASSSGLFPAISSPFRVSWVIDPSKPVSMFNLQVAVLPVLGGTVTISPNDSAVPSGTRVTLRAVPALGYKFVAWGGDILGPQNPIVLIVDSNKKVTCSFVPQGW